MREIKEYEEMEHKEKQNNTIEITQDDCLKSPVKYICGDCGFFDSYLFCTPRGFKIMCSKCGNTTQEFDTPEQAIEAWETRKKQLDEKEAVNHPSHYNQGKYECIEVMQETFGADSVKDFCLLNAFKYIWRAKQKNGYEDIKKAIWYLNKFLEVGKDDSGRSE